MNTAVTERPNIFSSSAVQSTSGNAAAQTDQQRAIAEVHAALMIARMNPRDERMSMERILKACERPTLADAAVYNYAKGGTDVSGPSIRLAEAMAQAWGNMQYGLRELEQTEGESTVQAYAWDVETNTRSEITFQVPHIRHTKSGAYAIKDPREIYELIANQGARRKRACILAVIPGDVTEEAVKQCEQTMRISADTSPEVIQKMVSTFATEFGVSKEQIEKRIQRKLEAIQPAHVVSLKKIYVSLRDGMSVVGDWFEGGEGSFKSVAGKTLISPEQLEQLMEAIAAAGKSAVEVGKKLRVNRLDELDADRFDAALALVKESK